jgi:hypothetical protein
MALYLGSNKINMCADDIIYNLNLFTASFNVNGAMLSSSDNYVLKDASDLFLTAEESD